MLEAAIQMKQRLFIAVSGLLLASYSAWAGDRHIVDLTALRTDIAELNSSRFQISQVRVGAEAKVSNPKTCAAGSRSSEVAVKVESFSCTSAELSGVQAAWERASQLLAAAQRECDETRTYVIRLTVEEIGSFKPVSKWIEVPLDSRSGATLRGKRVVKLAPQTAPEQITLAHPLICGQ